MELSLLHTAPQISAADSCECCSSTQLVWQAIPGPESYNPSNVFLQADPYNSKITNSHGYRSLARLLVHHLSKQHIAQINPDLAPYHDDIFDLAASHGDGSRAIDGIFCTPKHM